MVGRSMAQTLLRAPPRLSQGRLGKSRSDRRANETAGSARSDPQRNAHRVDSLRCHPSTTTATAQRSRKMTTDERTQTNLDTFLAPTSEAGALQLRPFSAGTLTLC